MSELPSSARAMACLLALVAPVGLASAQGNRPPNPDTTSFPVVVPAATPYQHAPASGATPYFFSDGRFSLLLVGGPKAVAMDALTTRTIDESCAERPAASELPPGAGSESVALGGQALVVIVAGAPRDPSPCAIEWNVAPLSLWRGALAAAKDGATAPVPLSARLIVDGYAVNPTAAYRRPAYVHTAAGWRREGAQLRYYYDMSVARPRDDGHAPQIGLQIWDAAAAPTVMNLEGAAERLEMEYVEWTLTRHPVSGVAATLALTPAEVLVPAVAKILDTAKIDLAAAGIRAAAWASDSQDGASMSNGVARLVSAEALLAQGDPGLARAVVASVERTHPCLVPPAGSSRTVVQLAAATRPSSARCEPVSPTQAAALSIVPGLGNLAVGERWKAALGAGLVAGALARAFVLTSQANSSYAEYRSSDDGLKAQILYKRVTDLRGERTLTLSVAAGLWIADAISAVRGAESHAERVARDRF